MAAQMGMIGDLLGFLFLEQITDSEDPFLRMDHPPGANGCGAIASKEGPSHQLRQVLLGKSLTETCRFVASSRAQISSIPSPGSLDHHQHQLQFGLKIFFGSPGDKRAAPVLHMLQNVKTRAQVDWEAEREEWAQHIAELEVQVAGGFVCFLLRVPYTNPLKGCLLTSPYEQHQTGGKGSYYR